jgi:hypothetical protein
MITQCFERVRNVEVLELLYGNEAIPDTSIVAPFNRAARFWSDEDVKIAKFLYLHKAVPSDAIDQAFANAVSQNRTDVIELLQSGARLTPKGLEKVNAPVPDLEEMREALYAQQPIPERTSQGVEASSQGRRCRLGRDDCRAFSCRQCTARVQSRGLAVCSATPRTHSSGDRCRH